MLMTPLRMKERHEKLLKHMRQEGQKEATAKEKKEHKDDAEVARRKILSVMEVVEVKSEKRNTYMSLAWTEPGDNTSLQQQVSASNTSRQSDTHIHQ